RNGPPRARAPLTHRCRLALIPLPAIGPRQLHRSLTFRPVAGDVARASSRTHALVDWRSGRRHTDEFRRPPRARANVTAIGGESGDSPSNLVIACTRGEPSGHVVAPRV